MSFTRYKATSNTPTKLESVKGPIAYSDSTIKLIRAELARILNDQFEPTTTVVDWSITPEEEVDPTPTQEHFHHRSPLRFPYNKGSTNANQTPEPIEESEQKKSAPRRS